MLASNNTRKKNEEKRGGERPENICNRIDNDVSGLSPILSTFPPPVDNK